MCPRCKSESIERDRRTVVDRLPAVRERGIEGPPTLVIEILSPSTTQTDRVRKRQLYARHGVPYYWMVDGEARAIEAYVLGPDGYTLALRAIGDAPVSPPPFEGLALVPAGRPTDADGGGRALA